MSETHSAQPTAFLCDQNLGRLARWLRTMGFDAQYLRAWDDDRIREAIAGGRIFLTRKRSLAHEPGVMVMESDHLAGQVQALDKALDLGNKIQPFSRCSICNLPLKCVKREDVEKQVPEYVYATHDEFARCPGCSRIYWKGTHPVRSLELIHSFVHKGKRG
jgi:uncharacterized protein